MQPSLDHPLVRASTLAAALAALSLGAAAQNQQVRFSIDWISTTVGVPDSGSAFPITEGDVLVPGPGAPGFGPLPVPAIRFSAGFAPVPGLGLPMHAACAGHLGGTPCAVEVDALSFGQDVMLPKAVAIKNAIAFSTDEYARGIPGMLVPPTVWTENMPGDLAADVLVDVGLGVYPLPPFAAVAPGSVAFLDGNGLVSGSGFTYPGIGLREPRPPAPVFPKPGDNLDALEIDPTPASVVPPLGFFFSLDAAFVDPLTGVPNTASAAANGFLPGMVLRTAVPGGAPGVYAPPPVLGLDLAGFGTDDLDALILTENGVGGYQPSQQPGDWTLGLTDMLLFSVRRGSAVIGMPDSIFGIPIEPGDILTTPLPAALGGVSPFPGILVAAENLGLATARSFPIPFGDDLNAADSVKPFFDCNGNGVEDALDIATGSSADANSNGLPDECEGGISYHCFCPAGSAPCGNVDPGAGCRNSTGQGGLLTGSGSFSVGLDNLVLTATQLPPLTNGILIQSSTPVASLPFGDGLRCVGGNVRRWPFKNSGVGGTFAYGPGMSAFSIANFGPPHHILAGTTFHFQAWYRDQTGPCGTGFNLTNSATVSFAP